MAGTGPYDARLSVAAARQFKKLPPDEQRQVRKKLNDLAETLAKPGARGGKSLKKIQGRHDDFYRVRVGDLRVMFEVIPDKRILLVAGIVDRSDLERWLRGK